MSAVVPPIVPEDLRAEAERLLGRYLQEVIEPFGLCPWAKATRARGELWIDIAMTTSLDVLATQVARFLAATEASGAVIGMIVFAGSGMSSRKLLELRDLLLAHAGVQEKLGAWPGVVIADFHPAAAEPDLRSPSRALPFIRRSPDPMLQLARRDVIEGVTRGGPVMVSPSEQLAALIGNAPLIGLSASDEIAARNHQTLTEKLGDVQAISDSIARDRAATYERLGLL